MKPTVLIVEDDRLSRKLLSELLTVKGFRILEAQDGRQGLEQAFAHLPELILMDIQMPEMDGFGAIRALKNDLRTCSITIWALTAFAMPGDGDRIRACGCDGYFTKPLDLCELLARVECHFENTGQ